MIIGEYYYEDENDYDEEYDDCDEDEEEGDKGFECYFDIDCEDCGYYIDHEGMCPFKTGLFIK